MNDFAGSFLTKRWNSPMATDLLTFANATRNMNAAKIVLNSARALWRLF
jgi:hypothetical protein